MDKVTLHQIKGLKNFIQDAVEAAVNTTATTHQAIAEKPYAELKKIAPLAEAVSALEQAQESLTSGFYHGIIAATRINSAIAEQLIDYLERQGDAQAEQPKSAGRRGR
jgi:hypothetical protein